MNLVKDLPDIEINGQVLYSSNVFQDAINHFAWFHDFKIKTKQCSVDDIKMNPNEKYYFIHFISFIDFNWLVELYNSENIFSKKIKELLKQKNFRLIFLDVHESQEHDKIETLFESFTNKEKILFINNDYNLKNKKIKTIKSNFLVKNSINGYYAIYREKLGNTISEKNWNLNKRDFMFLCKNKQSRKHHRWFTLCLLKKYDLLDKSNYSCLMKPETSIIGHHKFNKDIFPNFDSTQVKLFESISFPKYTINEKDFNFDELNQSNYNFAGELQVEDYKNSYINIVTESVYFDKMIHITEKSFKPFFLFQLPLFVASKGHVDVLRKKLNLDLFDDFINHDYDKEENHTTRLKMIIEECCRLSKLEKEIIEFLNSNKNRFENNIKLLEDWKMNSSNENDTIKYILKF